MDHIFFLSVIMKKEPLLTPDHTDAIGIAAVSPAQAKQIDVVNAWTLNNPSKDCFRSFKTSRHKKTGWTYYHAAIKDTSRTRCSSTTIAASRQRDNLSAEELMFKRIVNPGITPRLVSYLLIDRFYRADGSSKTAPQPE